MNYKFLKISSYYRDCLNKYYNTFKDIVSEDYEAQYKHLMSMKFSWSDFFQTHLKKLGNEAFEIVSNAKFLQRAWAREHNISYRDKHLLLDQIKYISPDVLFLQDCLKYSPGYLDEIRKTVPSIKQIIGWSCSPFNYSHITLYSKFDYVIGCSHKFIEFFKKLGIKCYEINHAFEPNILEHIKDVPFENRNDFIFVGSLIIGNQFHNERIRLLDEIARKYSGIQYYINVPNLNAFIRTFLQLAYFTGKTLSRFGLKKIISNTQIFNKFISLTEFPRKNILTDRIKNRIIGEPLYGLEMYKALSNSKVGFNSHGGIAEDYAANARMFEVTGVGTCLLTDEKVNINKFFNKDTEIVTYKSVEECIEKIDWLLNNAKRAREIAESGQKRTLRDHNFNNRAAQLHEIIIENFK